MTIGILKKGTKGIIGDASLKQTKLNLVAPSTHTIKLNEPLPTEKLCTTALIHVFDENDIMTYECQFDNSASENFTPHPYVTYEDGAMKLNSGAKYEMKPVFQEEYFKIYESPTISKINWEGIEKIVYRGEGTYTASVDGLEQDYTMGVELIHRGLTIRESDSLEQEHFQGVDGLARENNSIRVKNINTPVFVEPTGDIDLAKIDSFTSIDWSNHTNENGISLLLISIDNGKSWRSYYENEWISVDIENKLEIRERGMQSSTVNALNVYDIDRLNTAWDHIRFGYYLELTGLNGQAMNNSIAITVRMPGEVEIAGKNSYEMTHSKDTITYTFLEDGTYTINTFSP